MASLILSIVGMFFVGIGLVPACGFCVWIGFPFLLIGLILGIVNACQNKKRTLNIVGLSLCACLMIAGVVRVTVGTKMIKDTTASVRSITSTIENNPILNQTELGKDAREIDQSIDDIKAKSDELKNLLKHPIQATKETENE